MNGVYGDTWNKVKPGRGRLRNRVTKTVLLLIITGLMNPVTTFMSLLLFPGIRPWWRHSPARRRSCLLRRNVDLFSSSVNYKAGRLVTYKLLTYQFRILNKWAESLRGATGVSLAKTNRFDVFGKARRRVYSLETHRSFWLPGFSSVQHTHEGSHRLLCGTDKTFLSARSVCPHCRFKYRQEGFFEASERKQKPEKANCEDRAVISLAPGWYLTSVLQTQTSPARVLFRLLCSVSHLPHTENATVPSTSFHGKIFIIGNI